ncbi:MAG: hypothetical protein R6V72_17410 [Cyclobacterium sp.]|uniref:hypothetical protein n=1 Tax=Cyclobacterium sp. TaxID=1966343 RepID=UPI00397052E5
MAILQVMRNIFICCSILVLFGCSNPGNDQVDVSYDGEIFSFKLEELKNDALSIPSTRAWAKGKGFIQATGELDFVFSKIFKGFQINMGPKWEGRIFKLTINYAESEGYHQFFDELTARIQDETQINIFSEMGLLDTKCLKVINKDDLQLNSYQINQGVLESSDLSEKKLKVSGKTLNGLVDEINKLDHLKRILYKGLNKDVYQFELDVTNETSLNNSLLPYGLSLTDCEVDAMVVDIK